MDTLVATFCIYRCILRKEIKIVTGEIIFDVQSVHSDTISKIKMYTVQV